MAIILVFIYMTDIYMIATTKHSCQVHMACIFLWMSTPKTINQKNYIGIIGG